MIDETRARSVKGRDLYRDPRIARLADPDPDDEQDDEPLPERPRTRGDCVGGLRPCPWVGCQHNLFLEVGDGGGIKLTFPLLEPHEMGESCALDVADRVAMDREAGTLGGTSWKTLEEIGTMLGITRERVRQVQSEALRKAGQTMRLRGLALSDLADADPDRPGWTPKAKPVKGLRREHPLGERQCWCGCGAYLPDPPGHTRGRPRHWASPACRARGRDGWLPALAKAGATVGTCPICGEPAPPSRIYCGPKCTTTGQQLARNARRAGL